MNTFFYQIEILKQEEMRRHLTAERIARIHEAQADTAMEPGRTARVFSAISLRWRHLRADKDHPASPALTSAGMTPSRESR